MLSGVHRGWWHRASSFIFSFRIHRCWQWRNGRFDIREKEREKKPVRSAGNTLVSSIVEIRKGAEGRKKERKVEEVEWCG